jgi:hypothetical protein
MKRSPYEALVSNDGKVNCNEAATILPARDFGVVGGKREKLLTAKCAKGVKGAKGAKKGSNHRGHRGTQGGGEID